MTAAPPRARWVLPLVLVAYVLLGMALHHVRGATDSGFGSVDDEPAHFVTGLMVRDYLASGLPGSPTDFAKDYYLHYPKVGIGQWPPVFYALQGLWMLVAGESTFSLVLFMSVLCGLLATCVFAALRPRLPDWGAWSLGLLFLWLPLVQQLGSALMTEIPVALFCLLAALQFGRFLATGLARHAFGFGGFAILGILTKGNALALALLPPLAILLSGRFEASKRPSLWLAGLMVAAVCGPWYWLALPVSASTWQGGSSPTLEYTQNAVFYYARGLVELGGGFLAAMAVLGLFARPRDPGLRAAWAALVALALGLLLIHCVVPSSLAERHLVLVAPVWLLAAASGLFWLLTTLRFGERARALAPLLLLSAFFAQAFEIPSKRYSGYRAAAERIVADPTLRDSRLLIASDALGEGLFTAAVAHGEERPRHYVLRGSKVLGRTTWMGDDYEPIVSTADEVQAFLSAVPVGIVAVDLSSREHQWYPYHEILLGLLGSDPDTWRLVDGHDVVREGVAYPDALLVFRHTGHEHLPRSELVLQDVLGRDVPWL